MELELFYHVINFGDIYPEGIVSQENKFVSNRNQANHYRRGYPCGRPKIIFLQ